MRIAFWITVVLAAQSMGADNNRELVPISQVPPPAHCQFSVMAASRGNALKPLEPPDAQHWSHDVTPGSAVGLDPSGRYYLGEWYPNADHSGIYQPRLWDTKTGKTYDLASAFPDVDVYPCGVAADGSVYLQSHSSKSDGYGKSTWTSNFYRYDPVTKKKEVLQTSSDYGHSVSSAGKGSVLYLGEAYAKDGEVTATVVTLADGKRIQCRLKLPEKFKKTTTEWRISDAGTLISTRVTDTSKQPPESTFVLWRVPKESGGQATPIQTSPIWAYAPDGKSALTKDPKSGGLRVSQFGDKGAPKNVPLGLSAELLTRLRENKGAFDVADAAFSPDGNYVAAVLSITEKNDSYQRVQLSSSVTATTSSMLSSRYVVLRWNLNRPDEPPHALPIPEEARETFAKATPRVSVQNDGSYRVAGANDKNVWVADSSLQIFRAPRPADKTVAQSLIRLDFTADGQRVLVSDHTGLHMVPVPQTRALPGGARPSAPRALPPRREPN